MNSKGLCAWYDLFSSDIPKSVSFYTQLFGWTTEEWKIEGAPSYTMFKVGDLLIGGVTAAPVPQVNNTWLAYVTVPNLKEAVEKIQRQDGKILFEKSAPGVGSWVIAQDKEGVIFSPFQAEDAEQLKLPPMPAPFGVFCWHELMSKDRDASLQFYASLFDWKKGLAVETPMGTYQIYNRAEDNEKGMGGMMNICTDMPVKTPYWLEYIFVEDVEKTLQKAFTLGAKPTFPVMPIATGGKIAGLMDPQGTALGLVQMLRP